MLALLYDTNQIQTSIGTSEKCLEFWKSYRPTVWGARHSKCSETDEHLSTTFPFVIHCDGAQYAKEQECQIYSWSSGLLKGASSWDLKFLITAISDDFFRKDGART